MGRWRWGAWIMALAVAAGAFGAHVMRGRFSPYELDVFETAVLYQFIHAVTLIIVPLMGAQGILGPSWTRRIWWIFLFGILVFCGSLYVVVLGGIRWFGALTPVGGVAFIVGWVCLALAGSVNGPARDFSGGMSAK